MKFPSVRRGKYITVGVLFFICLIVSLISIFAGPFIQDISDRENKKKCYNIMIAFHARVEKNIPDNAVIFIGDSHEQGLCVAAVTPYGVNLGIGGDSTSGLLLRLKPTLFTKRVRAVVIAVGINDIIQRKKKGISERLDSILAAIPTQVPVILSAIFPVDEEYTQKIQNEEIFFVNRYIASVCSKYDNCHLSKSYDMLKDNEGNLSSECHIGDGIHLNV